MFWLGLIACLLPRRYRRWWDEQRACSIVEGGVQAVACAALLFARLLDSLRDMTSLPENFVLGAAEASGYTGFMAVGAITGITMLLSPVTLLLAFFALEGYVRVLAAMVTGETVSTLPAFLVGFAHDKADERRARRHAPPPRPIFK